MSQIQVFEKMLDKGQDSSLLRYSLGNAYATEERWQEAADHLQLSVEQDPDYSAAWKLLGKCQEKLELYEKAIESYCSGIEAAVKKGDKQAQKEMTVFQKRLVKKIAP